MAKSPASDAMKGLPSMEDADPAPEVTQVPAAAPEAPAAPAAAPAAVAPPAGPTPGSGIPVWVDSAVAKPGGVWKVPGTNTTIRTN